METYKNFPLPEQMTQRKNTTLFKVREKSTGQAVTQRRFLVTKANTPPKAGTFKSQH